MFLYLMSTSTTGASVVSMLGIPGPELQLLPFTRPLSSGRYNVEVSQCLLSVDIDLLYLCFTPVFTSQRGSKSTLFLYHAWDGTQGLYTLV